MSKSQKNISESSESSEADEYFAQRPSAKVRAMMATRPNASPGYWLCCLLPLAFGTHYLHSTTTTSICGMQAPQTYTMLAIASAGMCVESLCFFAYLFLDTGLHMKLMMSFVPGLLTMLMYGFGLEQTWRFAIFWGFAVTFCYQNAYIRVINGLPYCFSFGEAAVLVQGLMLFVLNAVLQLPAILLAKSANIAVGSPVTDFSQLNTLMINALFCLFIACCLLAKCKFLRQPHCFYPFMILLVLAVTCIPVTQPLPVVVLFNFLLADTKRISIIVFYLFLVALTISTVCWQLRHTEKASTRVRKIFHLLIVLVYIPGLAYQCAFLYIATGVALSIFTVLELFRILEIPPLADSLKLAFASFSDEKDAGLLALTPFCLLIGCSLPIWISPCPCNRNANMLSLLAGILAIGCGDSAASVLGSKYGRIRWSKSTRTLEGTAAFIATVIAVVACLNCFEFITISGGGMWLKIIIATCVTAFVEARTDQIDNLVLPLVFYIVVNVT